MEPPNYKSIFVLTMLSLLTNFQYGYSTTYMNTPIATFKNFLNESITRHGMKFDEYTYNWMWNLIINIWFLGSFMGMWLAPFLNEQYGRRVGFLVGNSLSLLGSILRLVAIITQLPELLFLGRLIIAVAVSIAYQSLILYLQECSPTRYRGMLSFTSEISFAAMCTLGMVLGTNQVFGSKLHLLLGVAVIPSLFSVLVIIPLPETPKFLYINRSDEAAAVKSIKFFQGDRSNVKMTVSAIQQECEESSGVTVSEIFSTIYLRKAVLLSLFALQNTIAFWSLLLSSTYFLQQVHLQNDLAEWSSTAMAALYTAGTITGFFIIERVRRRSLILISATICLALLILFVVFALLTHVWPQIKYACLVCSLFYGFTYGFGVGTPSWILCTELVAQQQRSLVQSVCYAINAAILVVCTFAILPLYQLIDVYAFLLLYAIPSIISLLVLYRYLPETANREIYSIVRELKQHQL